MAYAPLSGVRVLEWARDFPGPHTGRKLADMGADVVKIADVPRGNGRRPSKYAAEWWAVLDRNKRSIAFDLSEAEDRATVRRLAEAADVVIEGARPGAFTAKTGIDFADIRRASPHVVICSVSGFGQTGPLARQPAHGLNLEAISYCLYPEKRDGHWYLGQGSNLVVAVEMAPVNGAFAIMAALWHAAKTGEGAWIDISCWDAAIETHRHRLADVLNGKEPWYDVPSSGPRYAVYEAGDGRPVFFGGSDRHFWENFCRNVEREDLIDAGCAPGDERDLDADASLRGELEEIFRSAPALEWNDRFREWNVAGTMVLTSLEEIAEHPHFAGRGMLTVAPDGAKQVADPIRWVDTDSRPGDTIRPHPEIGGDTADVLAEWLPG